MPLWTRPLTAQEIRVSLDRDMPDESRRNYIKELLQENKSAQLLFDAIKDWSSEIKLNLESIKRKAIVLDNESARQELQTLIRAHKDSYPRLEKTVAFTTELAKTIKSEPQVLTCGKRC